MEMFICSAALDIFNIRRKIFYRLFNGKNDHLSFKWTIIVEGFASWPLTLTLVATLHFDLHLRVFVISRRRRRQWQRWWRRLLAGSDCWGTRDPRGLPEILCGSPLARSGVSFLARRLAATRVGGAWNRRRQGPHLPQGQRRQGHVGGHGLLKTLVVVVETARGKVTQATKFRNMKVRKLEMSKLAAAGPTCLSAGPAGGWTAPCPQSRCGGTRV